MIEQEKQLLLADLCARLPYGVKYKTYLGDAFTLKDITFSKTTTKYYIDDNAFSVDQIKPFLRPLSSMTEEEKGQTRGFWIDADTRTFAIRLIDFYNKNHFDYRGLIPKGLALEATEGMYKT